jgi:hypothetical protein
VGLNVRLTRSGGFAGLSMVADVDLDALPKPAAEELRAALAGVDFDPPARPSRSAPAGRPTRPTRSGPAPGPVPGPADMYQYDLVVKDGTSNHRSLTVHEPVSDPGLQTLFGVLLPLAQPE